MTGHKGSVTELLLATALGDRHTHKYAYFIYVTRFWKTDHIVTHEINRILCLCICNLNKYILLNYFQCLNNSSYV